MRVWKHNDEMVNVQIPDDAQILFASGTAAITAAEQLEEIHGDDHPLAELFRDANASANEILRFDNQRAADTNEYGDDFAARVPYQDLVLLAMAAGYYAEDGKEDMTRAASKLNELTRQVGRDGDITDIETDDDDGGGENDPS